MKTMKWKMITAKGEPVYVLSGKNARLLTTDDPGSEASNRRIWP